MRNGFPVVIAVATNDALGASFANIASLYNRKNVFFVPCSQDDHVKKERSIVARFGLCDKALELALQGRQLQPVIL
jgi:dipicolinate synthase subunit B